MTPMYCFDVCNCITLRRTLTYTLYVVNAEIIRCSETLVTTTFFYSYNQIKLFDIIKISSDIDMLIHVDKRVRNE